MLQKRPLMRSFLIIESAKSETVVSTEQSLSFFIILIYILFIGHVVELAYTYVSETYPVRVGGSNPLVPTFSGNYFCFLIVLDMMCV